jgi:hypothetical protein
MQLDLTDEESASLLRELNNIIENDRYPLSPRIRVLRGIRAKFPSASTPAASSATDGRRAKSAAKAAGHRASALGVFATKFWDFCCKKIMGTPVLTPAR